MVRKELFRECTDALDKAGIPDSSFDVMCIFEDMLNEKNPLFRPLQEVSPQDEEKIRTLAEKRCEGEPLQYLLGCWEFWGLPVKVGRGVLIPRPDTETLVEEVLDICRKNRIHSPKIADLCSGSGCIALALKKEIPLAEVYAVELSSDALKYLESNVEMNSSDVKIVSGDVLKTETAEKFRDFDIIVSNPPYLTEEEMNDLQTEVQKEPSSALFGGTDGLDFYRKITSLWKNSLRNGGWLCYEFGMGQHGDVEKILTENNFSDIRFARDGGGIIRTAAARKTEV